jgi:glycosyltransferase involved in cell wall biosynthesis
MSMKKSNKLSSHPDYVIIGDTHPEFLALAKYLASKKINALWVSSLYFKNHELKLIQKIPSINKNIIDVFNSNVLDFELGTLKFRRPYMQIEILQKVLGKLRNRKLDDFLRGKLIKKYESQIIKYSQRFPNAKIILPPIPMTKKLEHQNINLIAYHGHPIQVAENSKLEVPVKPHSYESKIFEIAKKIFVLSDYVAFDMEKRINKKQILHRIPGGPIHYPQNLESCDLLLRKGGPLKCLILGRIVPEKGLCDLVQLKSLLPRNLSLTVAGQTNSSFSVLLENEPCLQDVQFEFNLQVKEVIQLLKATDIILSMSYHEGFGISLLEGMSYGCIPIATTHSAAPEILSNSSFENNLYNPGDLNSLVRILSDILLLSDKQRYLLCKESQIIANKYSYNYFAEKVFQCLA